ncbi:MAG: hypothetical protein WBM40_05270 [Thiohalocapsa sp.]
MDLRVAIASRAIAFYYLLQCPVAPSVTRLPPRRSDLILVACGLGYISVCAVPAR